MTVSNTTCRVSGGFHRWTGVTIHTTPTGAIYTLGGTATCDHCHDSAPYHGLPHTEAQAICRAVAATFTGPLSESFALWALEAHGVTHDARDVMYQARHDGHIALTSGEFVITVRRAGYDDLVGTTYTVDRNAR
jgi:hypothetical protein